LAGKPEAGEFAASAQAHRTSIRTTKSTAPVNSNRNRFTKAAEETNYFQETRHAFQAAAAPKKQADRRTVGLLIQRQVIASF